MKQMRKAAMYVRMSTDHQKYSTQNQSDAILEYAKNRDIEIIVKYADEGKSGLSLRGRNALKQLFHDIENHVINIDLILVLDITRWGRFQDPDESAHYEYICKLAGVRIEFVAEQFENDGSISSDIFKTVKRIMAGEYSRELSQKVFTGQCRLIELGYRQGGAAGYGLRRMLVDERGNHKFILKPGERKSLQTDRVILVPGPAAEIKIISWIYQKFIKANWSDNKIAYVLNQRCIKTDFGNAWSRGTVHQILTNEKYIGNNIYNRTSNKLNTRTVSNSEAMWVRSNGAFEAIISPKVFQTAKDIIVERNRRLSDDEMLEKLHVLHQSNGWLSGIIIDEHEDMPSSNAYRNRFGSLLRAYKLVGYTPLRDYSYIEINHQLRNLHAEIVEKTIEEIRKQGTKVNLDTGSGLLNVSDEFSLSIVIARCITTRAGAFRWKIHLDTGYKPDISLAIRMDAQNQTPLDYYILPLENGFGAKSRIRLSEENGLALDAFRYDTLDLFFQLTERISIGDIA